MKNKTIKGNKMFAMYYPSNKEVKIGEILPFGQIKVEVLKIVGPFYWTVNGQEKYKLTVRKVLNEEANNS